MKFIIRLCLLLVLVAGNFFTAYASKVDTSKRNYGINLLLSAKPFFNALSAKDSAMNYMYSHSQFEVQFRYKRHIVGLGLNGSRKKSSTTVNNLPKNDYNYMTSLAPVYGYNFYSHKRWSIFAGGGYIYNLSDKGNDIISNIEIVSSRDKRLETGYFGFLRFNFRVTKKTSLEFEFAAYSTSEKITQENTFSLTPGMNTKKELETTTQTFAFPSNISFKFSL